MPIVRHSYEGEAPGEPHLAVLTDESGAFLAVPPGATLLLIEDPSRADKIFPFVLAKVSIKKLVMVCACKQPGCNLTIEWRPHRKGHHLPAKGPRMHSSGEPEQTAQTAPSPGTGNPSGQSSE